MEEKNIFFTNKIVKLGNSNYVCIPQEVYEANKLEKGDYLTIKAKVTKTKNKDPENQ